MTDKAITKEYVSSTGNKMTYADWVSKESFATSADGVGVSPRTAAFLDSMAYGTGVIQITPSGEVKHIPFEEFAPATPQDKAHDR